MKIRGPFGSFSTTGPHLERDSVRRSSRASSSSAANAESARTKGGTVNLSAEALLPTAVRDWFDGSKVDRLRSEYEGGRLRPNAREIAARMLEDA